MKRAPSPQRTGMKGILIIAACIALLPGAARADAALDEARTLLDGGQGAAAYTRLADQLEQRAGEPDYDYLLALAALEAGKPAVAVFALERVLTVHPDDAPALLALGRAHYLMGEDTAARRAFTAATQQSLAAADQAAAERYLNAIERRMAGASHRLTGYVELGGGYDSNINSATSDTTTYVPRFGFAVAIADASTDKDDSFLRLRGGVDYAGPLSAASRLLLGGRADLRRHGARNEYDTDTFDSYAGLRWLHGRNRYSMVLQTQQFGVDGSLNRELAGLALQWDRVLDARNQLSFFAQHAAVRYPYQQTRDVDQQSLGATWVHAFDAPGKPLFYVGGYAGADSEQDSAYPEYGQTFWGLRLGADYSLNQKLGLNGSFVWHDGTHDKDDPLFLEQRHDQLFDLSVGLHYRFTPALSLRPQLRYTRNDANISVNDFERSQFQLALRYDFN